MIPSAVTETEFPVTLPPAIANATWPVGPVIACSAHTATGGQRWMVVETGQKSTVTDEPAIGAPPMSRTVTWKTKSPRGQMIRQGSTVDWVGLGTCASATVATANTSDK